MSLPKPNLDDKTFAGLVDECLRLIPRHGARWTDFNASDPGVTLVELFAWLAETALYRVDRITDEHREGYLKLLGYTPRLAEPARVDIPIAPKQGCSVNLFKEAPFCVVVKDKALVDGEDASFRFDCNATVQDIRLKKIFVDEQNGGVRDRMPMNEPSGLFFAPFGLEPSDGCALYLGFEDDLSNFDLMFYVYEGDLIPAGAHGEEPPYSFVNADFRWEAAYVDEWKPIVINDGTDGFKKAGSIWFNPCGWTKTNVYGYELYWLRCVVENPRFEYPPRLERIIPNIFRATVEKAGTLVLGPGREQSTTGEDEWIKYRPAFGGAGEETLAEAWDRFLREMETPFAAATSGDIEYIALNTPGLRVAKAKAIPPEYAPPGEPKKDDATAVTVVVIPFTPLEHLQSPPVPSPGLLDAVCRHLDAHRVICTRFDVKGPAYVRVSARVEVVPSGDVGDDALSTAVTARLDKFLHPVKGGPDRDGWPIGRDVYVSEVREALAAIEGVGCVTRVYLSGDGKSHSDGSGNLALGSPDATVWSGAHTVVVTRKPASCGGKV